MSQGAGWIALPWGIALACIAVAASATPSLAQTTPSNTALPPWSGPPIDVPMHVPQPPRDVDNAPVQPGPGRQSPAAPARPQPQRSIPRQVVAAQERGGTITPIAPPCRETTYRVIIDGRPEMAVARLCRMADGQWRLAP